MRARWSSALGAFLLVLGLAFGAQAQRTGGSFGGGSFSRRSSSRGSSSRSFGGSRSRSFGSGSRSRSLGSGSRSRSLGSRSRSFGSGSSFGGSSSSRSRRTGTGYGIGGTVCCFLVVAVIFGLVVFSRMRKGSSSSVGGGGPAGYAGPDAMTVTRLSLGIDWRARAELQATLQRLAQGGDTSSPQGLANLLRETVLALRRAELAWLYVGHESVGPMAPSAAEPYFQQMATRMRSAFQHEVVRAGGGQVHQQAAPQMRAHPTEGEGTVVVHLIIAAYRLLAIPQSPDANQIRMALDNRAALTADQLAALEVVWSPAAENDRMSTAELEQFYPDMKLIDPNSIAGRIFCSYCKGPFAMELLNCPHCGAPAVESQGNRAPPTG